MSRRLAAAILLSAAWTVVRLAAEQDAPPPTMATVLEASTATDWQPLDPANTLHMNVGGGEVVIRLAPELAPAHVANIKALVAERFFDGAAVTRSQENYVVQWGDPAPEGEPRLPLGAAKRSLAPEFDRPLTDAPPLVLLKDPDPYADQTGFALGLPIARDPTAGRIWLIHCYGMVGVGRDVAPDSGNGSELYVVIGHAPRHLDRNVTLVGRVVRGMEHLSTLPRGTGRLGFYERSEEHAPIESIRLGSELPAAERARLEYLRTDTPTFEALIAARRTRTESWFARPTGRIGVCNVPLPVRSTPPISDPTVGSVEEVAARAVAAIRDRDFETLGRLADPTRGVTFTAYGYVRPGHDVKLTAQQLAVAASDRTVRRWGELDGTGNPIELTLEGYWERFVYDVDFAAAAESAWDRRLGQGNSLDNSSEVYPGARVVEYHFPGFDPDLQGLDWRSLRLVLAPAGDRWHLVGVIHDQWTI